MGVKGEGQKTKGLTEAVWPFLWIFQDTAESLLCCSQALFGTLSWWGKGEVSKGYGKDDGSSSRTNCP